MLVSGGTLLMMMSDPFLNNSMAATRRQEIKAIAFDAFPIFDPRPIFGLVKSNFPAHPGFGTAWFNKIFAYTWLRTSGDRYLDFLSVIGQALDYTAEAHGETMTPNLRKQLLDIWFTLKPWPDVAAALEQFEARKIRLAFLSNFTEEMLRANARNGGIENKLDYLSTDLARAFKPSQKAYALATNHFGVPKENIAFCAFAAWDAAGASWYGYPTVWVNRLGQKPEYLNAGSIASGQGMDVLTDFISTDV